MPPKIQVDSYDYQIAIEKIKALLEKAHVSDQAAFIDEMPSATLIVDTVIDTIL